MKKIVIKGYSVWRLRIVICAAFLIFAALTFGVHGDTAYGQAPSAPHRWNSNGLQLEIAPLTTDQVRAFFIGRGFSATDADFIAREGCIFRSSIGSALDTPGAPPVTVHLDTWQVVTGTAATALRTRESWSDVWKRRGADDTAQIAFYWALFPTSQEFGPTDRNWGLLSFGLKPASRFDLKFHWQTGDTGHKGLMQGLQCEE